MAGLIRTVAIVGTIALFSPVHDRTAEHTMAVMREAPRAAAEQLAAKALSDGPRVALETVRSLDPESRARLAQLVMNVTSEPPAEPARAR